jgi:hypothetical protein
MPEGRQPLPLKPSSLRFLKWRAHSSHDSFDASAPPRTSVRAWMWKASGKKTCRVYDARRRHARCPRLGDDFGISRFRGRPVSLIGFSCLRNGSHTQGPCLKWVKSGKTRNKHLLSAIPPEADFAQSPSDVGVMAQADSCAAANRRIIRLPRRRGRAVWAATRCQEFWRS